MHPLGPSATGTLLALLLIATGLAAQTDPVSPATSPPVSPGVEQLRHDVGTWDVTTEFLAPDGSVRRTVKGTYQFEWVVPDRVVIGRTEQPELGQASGILYYYRESTDTIEQVSVGADGHLWVLSGPADGDVRMSPPTQRPDGSTIQLRFTHYNVEPDRFESKMEITRDGGETWVPGNHQVLTRRTTVGSNTD